MKKFLFSLIVAVFLLSSAVLAEENANMNGNMNVQVTKPEINVGCLQNAIDKRDTAIISSWDVFSPVIKTALETRKSALKDAVVKPTLKEKRMAVRAAWDAFRKTTRDARKKLQESRRVAWKQFRTNARLCGPQALSIESGSGESLDASASL